MVVASPGTDLLNDTLFGENPCLKRLTLELLLVIGSLPRPPENLSHFGLCADTVCSWPLLTMNLDTGIIFVGNDVNPRKGELQLERFRQNQDCAVDTRCLDLAGIGMICVFDLPTFCLIATIASSLRITSTLPLILEDCCEFLYLVSMACEATAVLLLSFRRLSRTHTTGYIASLLVFVAVGLLQLSIATLLVFLQGQKEDCFFPHCSHKLENYFSKLQFRFGVYKSQVLTLKVVTQSGGLKALLWFLFGSLSRPPELKKLQSHPLTFTWMLLSLRSLWRRHIKFYKSKVQDGMYFHLEGEY